MYLQAAWGRFWKAGEEAGRREQPGQAAQPKLMDVVTGRGSPVPWASYLSSYCGRIGR